MSFWLPQPIHTLFMNAKWGFRIITLLHLDIWKSRVWFSPLLLAQTFTWSAFGYLVIGTFASGYLGVHQSIFRQFWSEWGLFFDILLTKFLIFLFIVPNILVKSFEYVWTQWIFTLFFLPDPLTLFRNFWLPSVIHYLCLQISHFLLIMPPPPLPVIICQSLNHLTKLLFGAYFAIGIW